MLETETYPDLVVWDEGDLRDVALHDGRESDLKLCPDVAVSRPHEPRLLAPRDELLVLVYTRHNLVHLLWSVTKPTS